MRTKTFTVYGTAEVQVTATIEIECECCICGADVPNDDCICDCDCDEKAWNEIHEQRAELTAYCGNGGIDKLVGVNEDNISLDPGCIEWECCDEE